MKRVRDIRNLEKEEAETKQRMNNLLSLDFNFLFVAELKSKNETIRPVEFFTLQLKI